jgi:hypothetical protein
MQLRDFTGTISMTQYIHPFVWYLKNPNSATGEFPHLCYAVIPDSLTHDTAAICISEELNSILKETEKFKKKYSSAGAASH